MSARVSHQKLDPKPTLHLPRRVKVALVDFQSRLLELFPDEINQLILYGSYSRGEARTDSDIDVMVVVDWYDSQRTDGYYLGGASDLRWRKIIDAAVDTMIAHGPFISALVVGESLFNSDLPVAQVAKQEGKVLWTSRLT